MYFPIGWPKVLRTLGTGSQQIVSNRDKILFATLSDDCIAVWYCKPSVPLVFHKRSYDSLQRLGVNVGVEWKPDSSMICISTSEGHLILYNVEVQSDLTAYQQFDPPTASLRRDSAELFLKEVIPSLKISQAVQGIWAQGIDDATCVRVNHKFRLIAIGRRNSQVDVFTIDELTGGLELSHTMVLSSKDFPGDPGPVKCIRWTGDGRAVSVCWERGGLSVWSTFGALLMCSLGWDYGLSQDLACHNPLVVTSMEWATEGYQLWMVKLEEDTKSNLIQMDFVKSPLSVNPCMGNQRHLYLQGDDKLYVNLEDNLTRRTKLSILDSSDTYQDNVQDHTESTQEYETSAKYKEYYSAIDESGENMCVAGRTGLAQYSRGARRWKLFGNEAHERDFVVTGGMLWWRQYVVVGCYSLTDAHDEIRFYPRDAKLDNRFAKIVRVHSQVFAIDMLDDQLVVFGADALVTIYELTCLDNAVDISALSHPACVVSASLCRLQEPALTHTHAARGPAAPAPVAPDSLEYPKETWCIGDTFGN
ncbi:unnamed protein product [Leptidea sinapis]|uniref:Uncharacterized protein n=1 Tax=Leptidea sinapis TaxID=189913 RepID=A0A5E4QRX8_9NEOP|nr:unnamed protein product [Leptidea sinapis]